MQTHGSKNRQLRVAEAAAKEPGGGAELLQGAEERFVQFIEGIRPAVGEHPFEMGPHALVGVELRRVGRESLQVQAPEAPAELTDHPAPVGASAIPEEDDVAAQSAEQMAQEPRDFGLLDVLRMKVPVEPQAPSAGAERESRDGRYPLAPVTVPEEGGLAPGRPGLARGRDQQEARFVEEDEVGAQPGGVFSFPHPIIHNAMRRISHMRNSTRYTITHIPYGYVF